MDKRHPLRRALDFLYQFTGAAAALCVFLIFILMIGASIGRGLNLRVGMVNDIVAWLCAGAAFFAMANAFKHGDFVRVTFVMDKLPRPAQRALEVCCLAAAAVLVGYLAWWATAYTYESYTFQDIATGMVAIPIWIPQAAFVIGSWLFWIAVIDELVIVLRGGRPSYQVAVEERHAKGDFSSDI